ncbi:MAG: hypothetical protein JJU34_17980 [Lunatimonas sp.]|uniref:putative collagen-binding domain-containing protein n=1 Tax=Lunatimonas sp. TaxID=2060141 RepID=UPI00263B15FA|nr:putative collagen-binding domain-containing protein [Lunatimonas sp.]MCC5939174.1 hypothetical protein [Lunatimonas sp.]
MKIPQCRFELLSFSGLVPAAIALFLNGMIYSCDTAENREHAENSDAWLKPYAENPHYWEYQRKPVLLLGATDDDNLFQMNGLEEHLDLLRQVGGNYIRNTMSSRDSGNVWPFYQQVDGLYDLDRWGDEYWTRFESLLKLCHERDIIVQIEVWDRFDFSRSMGIDGAWDVNPFNPVNTITYTLEETGLVEEYPSHPASDLQPFFHTVPGMANYDPKLDLVRKYQEKFVDKMLSYTLDFGNVLYCMNNETSTPVEWGNYWIDFIRAKAHEKGKEIAITDMYDSFYKVNECEKCLDMIAKPEYYTFLDISQINSRNFGQAHWDTLQVIMQKRNQYAPRPVNHTKIYGGGNYGFGSGSNEDGVERFGRNLLGGSASVRHHRPPHGNGLNDKAIGIIEATRKVEERVRFWDVEPAMELLSDREENEAYLAAKQGEGYILYFPKGGSVKLDLSAYSERFSAAWVSVATGEWGEEYAVEGGDFRDVTTPDDSGWYLVISE